MGYIKSESSVKSSNLIPSLLSPHASVQEQCVTSCVKAWYSVPVSQLSIGQGNEAGLGYVHKTKLSWHSPGHLAEDQCPTKVGDVFLVIKINMKNASELASWKTVTGPMCHNVWFQKISIPTPWKVIGNSEGGRGLNSQIYKGKYEAYLKIPGARGVQTKKTVRGGGVLCEKLS